MKMLLAALVVATVAMPAKAKDRFDAAAIGEFLKSLDTPTSESREFDRLTQACEKWIKDNALETSPVTYQRIESEEQGRNIRNERLIAITYDAQNLYGAIVRKKAVCRFDDAGHLIED